MNYELSIINYSSHGGLAQLARAPALQAGGQRFESVILHLSVGIPVFRVSAVFSAVRVFRISYGIVLWHIDTGKTVSRLNQQQYNFDSQKYMPAVLCRLSCFCGLVFQSIVQCGDKASKGARWMPWLTEAMKDVISCDKLRVGANDLWSADFRMGQPGRQKDGHHHFWVVRRAEGTEPS